MADPAPSASPPRRRPRTARQSRRPDGRVDRRSRRAFATGGRRTGRRSRDVDQDRQIEALMPRSRLRRTRQPSPRTTQRNRARHDFQFRRDTGLASGSARTRVLGWATPRPSRHAAEPYPAPWRQGSAGPDKPCRPLFPESPGPSGRGLGKPSGNGPAQRRRHGRRSADRRSPPRRAACAAAPVAASKDATSSDARAPTPSLLDRLAVKSILDNLRRPEAKAPAPQSGPMPSATASAAASAAPDAMTPKAAFPAGGLRDKLGVFTADRMQARRDAEEIKGASQAGTAVLASLEALERQETTGILLKIRDAANANGGIEHVLSEMRPGGAFEDLRKEFNVALSHDEGFAAGMPRGFSESSPFQPGAWGQRSESNVASRLVPDIPFFSPRIIIERIRRRTFSRVRP